MADTWGNSWLLSWGGSWSREAVVVAPFTFPTSFSVVRMESTFNADSREATIIVVPNESSFDVSGE